jgi:NADP-dependent 3-hydroxy acid dehydrogenase YdfG
LSKHIQDKVIVVTGAGSGFGRLISLKAAVLGARLVCADVNAETVEATVSEILTSHGQAIGRRTDVTNADEMAALAQAAVDQFGRIDVMINNAGVMPLAFYSDHVAASRLWHRCIDINIKGVLNGIVAVHDHMIAQGRGHIINISSIYGNFPVAGAGVYGATKAAVNFLSESLRVESQGKIKVTIVKPTGVPATGIAGAVVNPAAVVGILGQNMAAVMAAAQANAAGEVSSGESDAETITYNPLSPDYIAEQVIHAINQPWGVTLGDITIRAAGEPFIL